MKRSLPVSVLLAILIAAPCARAQVLAGGVFTLATTFGSTPEVASDASGNFIVTWSGSDDGDRSGLRARRYAADGTAVSSDFQVNTYTTGYQGNEGPAIAVDASGDFIIVWYSFGGFGQPSQDGSGAGVFAQRFSASGAPAGGELQVNTYTTGSQARPAVASDSAGNVTVVWWGDAQDGQAAGIFGQRYDASGAPRGGEFQVNSYTTGNQRNPAVASDPAGNVIVVWHNHPQAGAQFVAGQRFDSSGTAVGGEFQVVAATTFVGDAAVAAGRGGDFVVTWSGRDSDRTGVFARKYDASGAPVGVPVQVNTHEPGFQGAPDVAVDEEGRFIVTWTSEDPVTPLVSDVRARRFDAAGVPRGPEFLAPNTFFKRDPAVASDPAGNFVLVWSQVNGLHGQRFGGLLPAALAADPQLSSSSDGNGVLEPGETVDVRPSWRNVNGAAQTFAGTAVAFSGPTISGAGYLLLDATADYGTVTNGATAICSDCYRVSVPFSGVRPPFHWDTTLVERLAPDAQGQSKTWFLHVGDSFVDVPRSMPFYRFVETLVHHRVTAGCIGTGHAYCPADPVSREQMAPFVLVAKEGFGYEPAPCGPQPVFADVPVASPYCPWIEELARRSVVAGCGGGNYCPGTPVSREMMAVFVLRTLDPALNPPACMPPTVFSDVPETSPFCRWVEELERRQVVTGCGGGNYCPGLSVTRGQMAVFISVTFGLVLYGP